MMPVFRMRREAWPEARNRILLRVGPLLFLALTVGVGVDWWRSGDVPSPWICLFLAGVGAFGVWRGLRRQRENWEAFELEIRDEEIRARPRHAREFVLRRDEVKRISEHSRGLTLHGATSARSITLPTALENYAAARALVRGWGPVSPRSARFDALVPWLTGLATITLFAIALGNRGWVGQAAAAVLAVGLIWCLWALQRNPHVDARVRRGSWVVILPLITLIWRVLGPWLQ